MSEILAQKKDLFEQDAGSAQNKIDSDTDHQADIFDLDGGAKFESTPDFQLEMESATDLESSVAEPIPQIEFFLPETNPEQPEDSDQLELDGMPKPVHWVGVDGLEQPARHQHARTLLESLEAQSIQIPYQCREGYCGSCRTQLIDGEVAYLEEPMAWINEGEILPCCCVPKGDIKIKVQS